MEVVDLGSCDLRRPRGIFERASPVPSKSLTVEIWWFNLFAHLRDTDGEKYISPDLGVECSNTFWSTEAVQPPVAPDSFSWPAQADAGLTKLATLVSVLEIEKKTTHFSSLNLQNKIYRS